MKVGKTVSETSLTRAKNRAVRLVSCVLTNDPLRLVSEPLRDSISSRESEVILVK